MEYDSASSCEERLKDSEAAEELQRVIVEKNQAERELPTRVSPHWIAAESSTRVHPFPVRERSLSAQVMEYYQKYSQNSSLGRYFSLPETGVVSDGANHYRRMYESIPEIGVSREQYIILASEDRSRIDSTTPRERRRWARPPLIGQPSTSEGAVASNYVGATSTDSRTPSPICKRPITETIPEEQNESSRENIGQVKDSEGKASSPTSSVTSHKPLEWDSGADVGYYNALPLSKEKDKKLCTIERMALARGCSAALRLDPEGTNESTQSMSHATASRIVTRRSMKPDANSTPLAGFRHQESGESEGEVEITPIVKNHASGIITACEEVDNKGGRSRDDQTPKSKVISRQLEASVVQTNFSNAESEKFEESKEEPESSPLKKSASMNVLVFPLSRLSLIRSQSEVNLRAKEKKSVQPLPPLIFNSTSSIATVVNKPSTCDKFIQTSLNTCSRESIGIQVSVTDTSDDCTNEALRTQEAKQSETEEEKPPLPKRASSLVPKSLHSILKNSSNTYNVRDKSGDNHGEPANGNRKASNGAERATKAMDSVDGAMEAPDRGTERSVRGVGKIDSTSGSNTSSSNRSRNESTSTRSPQIPAEEDTTGENATGRVSNSFEYFPGHVYQNVRNGSTSRVSSIDTGRESRCSTMPNTSSSIDEKLWGDSDSLVRDLERSVNILKSLVDANKCDKQVKKRLIHHVIKRLVTAKYTDDRIERDLEENVPWNPADARNKVYRNEIIQALANKHNTTDSSADDWRPRKRNARGNSASPKKTMSKEARVAKEIIELVATSAPSTPNSDEFPFDRHTDRTVMDGRKARMGLRSEDRRRENTNTDQDRSESSECFLPQPHASKQPAYNMKGTNVFYTMNDVKSKEKSEPTIPVVAPVESVPTATTSTSTSSKNTACHRNLGNDGVVLVKEHRRAQSNETDWRLPTTMSERRFELGRCSNSESGDTKLINYAEMEKRNQLVWITNEISHLCNLKRLLQEPNKFGRERGTNSPKKRVDQWTERPRSSSRSRNERSRESDSEAGYDDKRVPRGDFASKNFENQWSSHGNLTGGPSAAEYQRTTSRNRVDNRTDIRAVRNTRKLRSSCTQTGSDGGPSGHSKTGGEIISSTVPILVSSALTRVDHASNVGVCDASVQTLSLSPRKVANAVSTEPAHSPTCPTRIRSNAEDKTCEKAVHVCYCQRYAAHSRHSACIVDSARRCARDHAKHCPYRARDDRPLIITATTSQVAPNPQTVASNSKSNDSRKEAKNQLNANCKSRYAIRELPAKTKARCAECELHDKILSGARITEEREKAAASRAKDCKKNEITNICVCPIECNCEVRRGQRDGDKIVNEKHVEENRQGSSYCETSSEPEEAICRHAGNIAQPPACSRCKRDTAEKPIASGCETEIRKKFPADFCERNGTENTRRSCRTCGTIWPVREGKNTNRKCSCTQDYLKPVAYELKFDETSVETSRTDRGMKIDKIGAKGLPTTEIEQTKASKSPPNSARSRGKCACDEDTEKNDADDDRDENQHPGTLKDFLATNKPQFLENVETRRQYMSELSQLRQLKKEKRKQFLAMAGSSVFLKPQKPAKGSTTNSQRKVSEYEMKLRLRMRYLRLNEVRNKRRQREKEEEARRNHLMAKLFGQKLQEKVLRGQVDLSQSVSVISNL